MSDAIDPHSIEAVAREALKEFAICVAQVAAPIGLEAFAAGPARDAAIDLARDAKDVLGTELAGDIVAKLDDEGVDIGDAHVAFQLAAFAQGKASSPIATVSVTKKRTIPLASIVEDVGSLVATCTLTTILTYEKPDADGQRFVDTCAKVALDVEFTSAKKRIGE